MGWNNLIDRTRKLLCRWVGHSWDIFEIGTGPYWDRECSRCGREETNEPLSIRNRRLHAEEYAKVQALLGPEMAGYFESAVDAAIEDVRRKR